MSAARIGQARIVPEPTDEEAAAIVAAIECGLARGGAAPTAERVSRWRWSGRWWSKPVPVRRGRPG